MPELPEVETVCRGLAPQIENVSLTRVIVRNGRLRMPITEDFAECLAGERWLSISRRAKYLLFLGERQVMIAHLGMSGALRIFPSPYEAVKHDHVLFELSSGKTLAFRDPRRFGLLSLCNHEEISTHRLFANLGPEPFAKDLSADFLLQRLAKKKQPIKIAIMDQSLIVGVGNIYASEALFRARIHPLRAAGEITKEEMQKLLTEIRSVLAAAIASGGSTLRDYVRSDGELGYFQHHFDVYGKAREACVICAAPIEVIRLGGRSSFFCSNCQK